MGRGIPAERSLSEISNGKSREVREAGSSVVKVKPGDRSLVAIY